MRAQETAHRALEYVLEEQIGFVLRQANQRHTVIFTELMAHGLTPTQFSALVKLFEQGTLSQNHLGRLVSMDAATIKGVTDRLKARGFIETGVAAADARLRILSLTPAGRQVAEEAVSTGAVVSQATLAPLDAQERRDLLRLLRRLI